MSRISKEYAEALFMLASEKGQQKNYLDDLKIVETVICEADGYMTFLKSLAIHKEEKIAAVREAFSGRISEDVLSYLMLLCERERISCFFESVEEYKKFYDASMSHLVAKVTSAVELGDSEKEKLEHKLATMTGKNVVAEYHTDESLIGGIVVEIDGKVIDGSIKGRLEDIKDVISG